MTKLQQEIKNARECKCKKCKRLVSWRVAGVCEPLGFAGACGFGLCRCFASALAGLALAAGLASVGWRFCV
ncbi:hypothetical protein BKN38_03035 [Helicobacter sp. CLO-3]|nr:hypothetical protein BA723_09190 [Helicobacter sp. CLO-3]OHU84442.1 hypothetical protein BKN38_03035 [Helicobacter sp. CLO-3]